MKKKITQWFIGLINCIIGLINCIIGLINCIIGFCVSLLGVFIVTTFISMMNSTGKEFVENFVAFVFALVGFIFTPYLLFHVFKNGVKDEYK